MIFFIERMTVLGRGLVFQPVLERGGEGERQWEGGRERKREGGGDKERREGEREKERGGEIEKEREREGERDLGAHVCRTCKRVNNA